MRDRGPTRGGRPWAIRSARHLRDEGGQILPALMVLFTAVLALGFMLFQAGHATELRANAQSAADASALAAAKGLREELGGQLPGSPVSGGLARAGASTYAQKNGALLTSFQYSGRDVLVTVRTNATLGEDAGDSSGKPATARARARLDPVVAIGGTNLLGVGASGSGGGGGGSCASPEELKEALGKKPEGIVALGKALQGLGVRVSEHPEFGGVEPVHTPGSLHYSGDALDLNAEQCGEAPFFDRLAPVLEEAGFNVLWRVPNHFDHIHVDTGGPGGGIGSGAGGGGGLDKSYEIRLVAWEG